MNLRIFLGCIMQIIDNKSKLLGDDLKKEIKYGSRLKIVASCFSIYAYEALKEELDNIDELQFIFSNSIFEKDGIEEKFKKESKEFFIPKMSAAKTIYGTDFEIRLKNQLTQKAIAKECANWIKKKVKFKTKITEGYTQGNIYLDNGDDIYSYTPINGFSNNDLGYGKTNAMLQYVVKADETVSTKLVLKQFNDIWADDNKLQDVTEFIINHIETAYIDNAPEFIYFLTLYNIFSEFLSDIMSEDFLPNEGTGFKTSLIWNKLYNFQRDGVIGIINKLEKYNGCILADSVGLGKTFTALAVMKYYSLRNKNILVLTPKKLANNWNRYRDNVKNNIFQKDRIHFDVLYHTDLTRKKGMSNGHDLALFNWDNYDLVVIDESHNFRNASRFRNKETRYDFLKEKVMKSGVKTKVLMLSATPVNNRFTDLKNQLALAYCDDYEGFNAKLDTSKSVETILKNAQTAFNEWTKKPKELRKSSELMQILDVDFSILLDNVTIARSRKHITKYYDVKDIGKFPKRRKPISYSCDLGKKEDVLEYGDIFEELMHLNMSVYAPMNYILDSRLSKYEELYDTTLKGAATLKQSDREKALQRLMSINLLKRLESCVESFRLTLKKIINVNKETLASIDNYSKNKSVDVELKVLYVEDFEDEDFDIVDDSTLGKVKIDYADMDLLSWKKDLKEDVDRLTALYDLMSYITPDKDFKLQKLIKVIEEKIENPFNKNNKKILVFSAFADTTDYLYENIADHLLTKYGIYTAKIQGGSSGNATNLKVDKDTDHLLTLFSPISKEREILYPEDKDKNIDCIIATDCVSEGQNLQDCDICINYDIHWNPVRIVQRFGRIDRIGSINETIQLVNFWPNCSLDEYIKLNARVENRMALVDATATGDDNIISEEQADLDYRKEQLKKLKEGELQDLEDVDGSITITDLGLNDFRMDMISYIKEYGEPKNVPKGLYAVVNHDNDANIKKGVVFVLKNKNQSININKQNRLHPYYLVYLDDEGNVVNNHMEVKQILDVLRKVSKNKITPDQKLCAIFNKETNEGYKMDKYSKLLDNSVSSIVEIKETNDLFELFTEGSNVLYQDKINGLDDFELITFFVIK